MSPPLLGHTQALKSSKLPAGLGYREGHSIGSQPRLPGPLVPGQHGQQALHSKGDESPPALAGGSSLFTQKPGSWEDLATPPFLCLLSLPHSSPWAAPLTARLPLGPKQISQPHQPQGHVGLWRWPRSTPAEGLRVGEGSRAVKSRGTWRCRKEVLKLCQLLLHAGGV